MTKPTGIIAYGRPEDRKRLAAVARHDSKTGSRVILDHIRDRYRELFGDLDPNLIETGDDD